MSMLGMPPQLYNLLVHSESGDYLYFLSPQAKSPIYGGKAPAVHVERMEKLVGEEGGYHEVLRKATEDSLSDNAVPTYRRNLEGLGNHLYEEIIPAKLKVAVSQMAKGDLIHIFADDEISIPWELVKNGGDFWGELYVVSNSIMDGEARVEPKPLNLPVENILNVIGYGIPDNVAALALELFQELPIQPTIIDGRTDQDATYKFYEQLRTADLVHFTGHGEIGSTGAFLRIVRQEDNYANFMVTSIGADSLRHGCIMFANACLSIKTKTIIRQALGFGPQFCQNGASAFIGTLDLVPGYPAALFAKSFYKWLFSGYDVGRALLAAKQTPLKYAGTTSLAPLLYSLYGNPNRAVEL